MSVTVVPGTFLRSLLFVDDNSDDLSGFIGVVDQAMAASGRTDHHIAFLYPGDLSVVIVVEGAIYNIEKLTLAFMNMESDGASRIQGDASEETAFST